MQSQKYSTQAKLFKIAYVVQQITNEVCQQFRFCARLENKQRMVENKDQITFLFSPQEHWHKSTIKTDCCQSTETDDKTNVDNR